MFFFLTGLSACVTHKDLLYSFTLSGTVVCSGVCASTHGLTLRLLDTGLDYKRKNSQYELINKPAIFGESFRFDADYFWGYSKVGGVPPPKRLVTIEVVAPSCALVRREVDLDSVPSDDAHFVLDIGVLELECGG